MTPIQQLAALALLACSVTSLPLAAVGPAAELASARTVAAPALSEAVKRQMAVNARAALAIDIPADYRQSNWLSRGQDGTNQGSCAWASLCNLLHWQGEHEKAELFRAHYGAGAGPDRLYPVLDAAGVPYATVPAPGVDAGSEAWLEWACRSRRGACVPIGSWCPSCRKRHPCEHMINLVGMDSTAVYLLDNNGNRQTYRRDRSDFLSDWRESGGWAFTPLYSPAPPKPWTVTLENQR